MTNYTIPKLIITLALIIITFVARTDIVYSEHAKKATQQQLSEFIAIEIRRELTTAFDMQSPITKATNWRQTNEAIFDEFWIFVSSCAHDSAIAKQAIRHNEVSVISRRCVNKFINATDNKETLLSRMAFFESLNFYPHEKIKVIEKDGSYNLSARHSIF